MNWDGSAGRIACHGEVGGIITSRSSLFLGRKVVVVVEEGGNAQMSSWPHTYTRARLYSHWVCWLIVSAPGCPVVAIAWAAVW